MYGQQITVSEQMKNNPSIFNNTGERFLLQNRIPLTLVMEPLTHFNNNNNTEFKIMLGRDIIVPQSTTLSVAHNSFGQLISGGLMGGDIYTPPNNGTFKSYVFPPKNNPNDPPGDPIEVLTTIDAVGTTLKVDRIYDVYIESIITYNTLPNTSKNTMAFMLQINDWNIDNNTNMTNMTKSIIIPNETTAAGTTNIHKAKKLNYLTHLTPDTITSISGKISFLNDTTIFHSEDLHNTRLSIELVLIPRNKN